MHNGQQISGIWIGMVFEINAECPVCQFLVHAIANVKELDTQEIVQSIIAANLINL